MTPKAQAMKKKKEITLYQNLKFLSFKGWHQSEKITYRNRRKKFNDTSVKRLVFRIHTEFS